MQDAPPGPSFILDSEYYGPIAWQYLGTVDIRTDAYIAWSNKYHPAKFFRGAYWGVTAEAVTIPGRPPVTVAWAVWVATMTANKGWKPKPGTPYHAAGPTYKGLPIAYSDAKVANWLANSRGVLVNNPLSLEQIERTLDRTP